LESIPSFVPEEYFFYLGQAVKSKKFGGTLLLRGPARVLSWSELVNFF